MIVKVGISGGDFTGDTNIAIQQAIEVAAAQGGGTVEIGPGTFTLYDSVRLRRNVRLVGSGEATVLRKCDGPSSGLVIDADYGQSKVTVSDPSGFRAGMGVSVTHGRPGGWGDSRATILLVREKVLYLDRMLITDYSADHGMVDNSCPLVEGVDVDSVTIEGLCLEGNRGNNRAINGCTGGGIYLFRARNCRIAHCLVRQFGGDGISFQIDRDITVEGCQAVGCSGLGIHPGTGSARPIIRDCKSQGNDSDGLFLCWRVQEGKFENNEVVNNGANGISIGHKDTDNIFSNNVIRGNQGHGIYFRDEKPTNAGSRNTFRQNLIEDNSGCGVRVEGHTTDLLFEENTIRESRSGSARTQQIGIWVGEQAARIRAVRNRIENHPEMSVSGQVAVED